MRCTRGGADCRSVPFPFHVLEGMNTRKENRIFFENVVDKRPRPFYARNHAHTMDGPLEKSSEIFTYPLARGGGI